MSVACALAPSCIFDWDALDPALGAASTSGSVTTGAGGSTSTVGPGGSTGTNTSTGGGGGAAPVDCGGMDLLADDFDSPTETLLRFYVPAGCSVAGGEAVSTLPTDGSIAWQTLSSRRAHDLRDDAISIEITSMVDTSTTGFAVLQVALDNPNYLEIYQKEGVLRFVKVVGGTWATIATVAYNPALHRFWRLREAAGTTYWETSEDDVAWVVRAEQPTLDLFPMDVVLVNLGAGTDGGEVDPGEARFGGVQGGGSADAWCEASSFTDDFEDGVRSAAWGRSYQNAGCTLAETGGALVITLIDGLTGYCAYASAAAYDLTGSSLAVEVPVMLNGATSAEAYFAADTLVDDRIEFVVSEGSLRFRTTLGGATMTLASVTYSPVDHARWRFRESAGVTYWETSPDGAAWTVRAQASNPIDVTAIDFELGAGAYQVETAPGAVHFDRLNLP